MGSRSPSKSWPLIFPAFAAKSPGPSALRRSLMVRRYGQRIALLSAAAVLMVGGGWLLLRDASAAACPGNKEHEVQFNGGFPVHAETNGGIDVLPGPVTTTPTGHI